MSIKGFKVNNQTEKYDYEALDNLPDIDGSIMETALDVSSTSSSTDNGVTFTNNGDGTWSLSGTASSSDPGRKYFAYYPTSIPSWLDDTKTLFINFRASDSSKVHAVVSFYYNGGTTEFDTNGIYEPTYVRIPDNATGFILLFYVAKGTEVNGVTINEFNVMYASGFDPIASQLKNSFAKLMLPSTFARVDKSVAASSLLDFPSNFVYSVTGPEAARTLLSSVDFPSNFDLGSSSSSITIIGFSISTSTTQYLVMRVNGASVYAGFYNRGTGLSGWSDIKGSKRRIRVLNIGHSGGQDVLAYTPYVIERIAPDIEFDLGLSYLSSATIDMMYDRILDNTIKDLEFDYKDHSSSTWVNSARNKSLAEILAEGPWDVILFEQGSYYEATWSSFHNLGKLIDAVTNWHRSTFGKKCKIGWVQVGPNPARTNVTFDGVIDCIHKILRSTQVEFVIPAGTATRLNALTHSLLTAIGNEGNMMADTNGHLQEGIPVLIGSYVSAMKLLEVCGCGSRSVEGDGLWPTQEWVNAIHSPGQNGTCVPSTPASNNPGVLPLAQKAAIAAIKYPETITKIYNQVDLNNWSDPYVDPLSAATNLRKYPYNVERIRHNITGRIRNISYSGRTGQKVYINVVKVGEQRDYDYFVIYGYINSETRDQLSYIQEIDTPTTLTLTKDYDHFALGIFRDAEYESNVESLIDFAIYDDNPLSKPILKKSPISGKYISILGASLSTFEGYIPTGYSPYYPHEDQTYYPVTSVHDTYWMKTIDALGLNLLINNSSSGAPCSTGFGDPTMAACGNRAVSLNSGNINPDIIVIQVGINDYTRNVPIGTYDGTGTFPTSTDTFREAYAIMLKKIRETYRRARIYCCELVVGKGGTYLMDDFPPRNSQGVLMEEYNKAIREIADLFGCKIVEFSKCGYDFFNVHLYAQENSGNYKQHANRFGHSLLANELIKTLDPSCTDLYQTRLPLAT